MEFVLLLYFRFRFHFKFIIIINRSHITYTHVGICLVKKGKTVNSHYLNYGAPSQRHFIYYRLFYTTCTDTSD